MIKFMRILSIFLSLHLSSSQAHASNGAEPVVPSMIARTLVGTQFFYLLKSALSAVAVTPHLYGEEANAPYTANEQTPESRAIYLMLAILAYSVTSQVYYLFQSPSQWQRISNFGLYAFLKSSGIAWAVSLLKRGMEQNLAKKPQNRLLHRTIEALSSLGSNLYTITIAGLANLFVARYVAVSQIRAPQ